MKMNHLKTLVFVGSLLVSQAMRADLTLNLEATTSQTGGAVPMTMKISSNAFRMDSGANSVIFNVANKKMMVLIPQTKNYMYMSIPKGDNMVADAAGKTPQLNKTGRKENINGYDCSEVVLRYDNKKACDLWLSKNGPKAGTILKNLNSFFDEQQSAQMGMNWLTFFGQNPEFDTFPIRTINHDANGREESRMTLISFNENPIPASEFVPPADYTEQKMPSIPGLNSPAAGGQGIDVEALKKLQQEMGGQQLTPEQIEQLKKMAEQMGH